MGVVRFPVAGRIRSLSPCIIVCRVLYGCMQKHGGPGSSKFGGFPRRGAVLRFLGGCEGREMVEFVNLLILPFKNLLPGKVNVHTCVCMQIIHRLANF